MPTNPDNTEVGLSDECPLIFSENSDHLLLKEDRRSLSTGIVKNKGQPNSYRWITKTSIRRRVGKTGDSMSDQELRAFAFNRLSIDTSTKLVAPKGNEGYSARWGRSDGR